MSKFYKLKNNLPTFEAGDIFELRADGCLWLFERYAGENHWKDEVMAYHKRTLEHFPNILRDWFEETEMPASCKKAPEAETEDAYQLCLMHNDISSRVLKRIGFFVLKASSAEEAVQIAEKALAFEYSVDADSAKKCFIATEKQEVED